VWVFLDARTHWRAPAAVGWALGTLAAAGLAVPVYLLIRPSRSSLWGTGEILGLTILFAVVIPLVTVTVFHVSPAAAPSLGVIAALGVFQNASFVAGSLYVCRVKYHLPPASLGLAFPAGRWVRGLVQSATAAAASLIGNSIGQHATVSALTLVIGERAAGDLVSRETLRTPIYRLLPHVHQRAELAVLAVLVGIVVPVGEEIFFRGLAFGAMRRRTGRHLAVVLSALFFAVAHLQAIEFLPIVILGIVLAYTYEFTGSLIPGMIAHGVNNLAALVLFYQASSP
jgi:membrane protease YdiL (CAAX protease family)